MLNVQPIVFNAKPDAGGNFATPTGQDLVFPLFLDAAATNVIVLPLSQVRFTMGTLSASNNCIGSYNAAGLEPANRCTPDDTHPLFVDAGTIDAYIPLAKADQVVIAALQESLCALFAGPQNSDGAHPVSHCKKDVNGNFTFKGDWCAATDMAANGNCADAVKLTATFAASSVLIND